MTRNTGQFPRYSLRIRVAHSLHTGGVTGSIPVAPTIFFAAGPGGGRTATGLAQPKQCLLDARSQAPASRLSGSERRRGGSALGAGVASRINRRAPASLPCALSSAVLGSRRLGVEGGRGGRLASVAASGARQTTLSPLCRGSHCYGDRWLGAAGGAGMAGVPADTVDLPVGPHRLSSQHLLPAAGAGRRPGGRSL